MNHGIVRSPVPSISRLVVVLFTMATALTATSGVAVAKTSISIESMTVNDLEVRALTCELDEGGLFAVAGVVSALAKQKKAFDACAAKGAAFHIVWTWAGKKVTKAEVRDASRPPRSACIVKALRRSDGGPGGTCEAILLVGEKKAAGDAADKLVKRQATPAPTPKSNPSRP